MLPKTQLGRRLTRGYILALSVIAATAVGGYVLHRAIGQEQLRAARMLSIAGEQRMLAQRIGMVSLKLALPRQWVDYEAIRNALTKARARLVETQRMMREGEPGTGLPPLSETALAEIYFEAPYNLNRQIADFAALTQQLLDRPLGEVDFYVLDELTGLAQYDLPMALAAAAEAHEDGTLSAIERMEMAQKMLLAVSIITLLGVTLGIFAPMVRRVEATTEEMEGANKALEHTALHDALTGLPNRRYLTEQLERMLASARRNGHVVGLLHVDLDKFKDVNDTLGHAAGDTVLCAAARVMLTAVRSGDFVARVGGDEFIIVSPMVSSAEGLGVLAERLIERIMVPIPYEGHMCEIGTSIGIALAHPDHALTGERLIMNADVALYEAKNQGRGCYRVYVPPVDAAVLEAEADAEADAEPAPAMLKVVGS
ncbi:MAG: diguanylate cyclase [Pseudomonadota bacterium]